MKGIFPQQLFIILSAGIILFTLSGCFATKTSYSGITTVRKYQKNVPFLFKNNIHLEASGATKDEIALIQSKLNTQLDDSAKVKIKDVFFILHYITAPPVFDSMAVVQSAANMQTSLGNIGYYHPSIQYSFDTVIKESSQQKRVIVNYDVNTGKRTLIDTVAYLFDQPDLQRLADSTKGATWLPENSPISKAAVFEENNRLTNLFRNHGYYKFTPDELRVTGDTSIAALTTISEDPFEQLRLLAEANEKRDKPTIRLGYQLNDTSENNKLQKYYINKVYILPDYQPGDFYKDSSLQEQVLPNYTIRFHEKKFRSRVFKDKVSLLKGNTYRQDDYFKTINDFSRVGVWESPNIDIIEVPDTNLLDVVIKLIPVDRYNFEGNVELSYSANSNSSRLSPTSSGNLLGLSVNLSLLDKNLAKSAIQMTNSIKVGVEFNTSYRNSYGNFISSNEITYSNNLLFPGFIFPANFYSRPGFKIKQSFINTNISLVNRIDFFNQQIFNTSYGFNWAKHDNHYWTLKLFNFDYRRIYNRSSRFDSTLIENPFLRYSFNTALIMGSSISYKMVHVNPRHPNAVTNLKTNLEESGLLWGFLKEGKRSNTNGNFFNHYLKEFIKADVEYTYTINHSKSAWAFRLFAGVGIPLTKSDTTLPFFKQYFGGGPNSMRGWPVRGIGIGGQKLTPFQSSSQSFNDRTGDIQLEGNIEYRFTVAPLFSNALLFKMALFTDIGNIWNFKNTMPSGQYDSAQFQFKNLYKQLAVSSGVGFRFDFNYFLLRFDVGFRFKRPDVLENDGWQFPAINFQHLFGSGEANRKWRYENFNATIGLDYPF